MNHHCTAYYTSIHRLWFLLRQRIGKNQAVDISNNKKKLHGFESCLSYFLVLKNLTWYFFCWLNPVRKWIPINYLHMTQKIHMHKIFLKKKTQFLSLYINQVSSAFFFCFYALSHRKLTYKSKYCDITSL